MCLVGSAESVVEGVRVWKRVGIGFGGFDPGLFCLANIIHHFAIQMPPVAP